MKEFKFLFNKLPFQIIFYPTSRCNANCSHCYNFNRQINTTKNNELSLDEINRISSGFGHIKALTISGGEPFLREDLKEIISIFYKNNGLQYVSIHTNAFLTQKISQTISEILQSLKGLNVVICISIDGIGKLHDQIRGVPDGFNKATDTIKELKKIKKIFNNLYLVSSTMYSHSTQDTFLQTFDYIQNEITGIKPSLSFIRGNTHINEEKNVNIDGYENFYSKYKSIKDKSIKPLSPMALKETLENIINKIVIKNHLTGKQSIPCQAGQKLVVIYENGDVYPCETSNQKFGNLRDVNYDIKKLLCSKEGMKIKRKIKQDGCSCTWENIILVNLIFNLKSYPAIIYNWFRLFILNK